MPRPGNSSSRVMPRTSLYQCFAASRSRTLMATWRTPQMGTDGFVWAVMQPPGAWWWGAGFFLAYVGLGWGECQPHPHPSPGDLERGAQRFERCPQYGFLTPSPSPEPGEGSSALRALS